MSVLCATAGPAPVAEASRRAGLAAQRAIVHAVLGKIGEHPCGPQPPNISARISTTDVDYALAKIAVPKRDLELTDKHIREHKVLRKGCEIAGLPLGLFLKRPVVRGNHWKIVVALQNSSQDCSEIAPYVPQGVLHEFHIEGIPMGSQTLGEC
jgi:hypothetical protein